MADSETRHTPDPTLSAEPLVHHDPQDDVYELLVKSNDMPAGAYNHVQWKIHPKGAVNSDAVLLTSVHEAMHHLLNNSTAYGLLLVIVAQLVRENLVEQRQMRRLVDGCRNAHEIYATYNSLLLTSSGGVNLALIQQFYPDYTKYLRQAEFLVKGVDKKHLHYPVLSALIEACFQNPALHACLRGQDPFNIPAQETPDQRLVKLSRHLTPDMLSGWVDEFTRQYEDREAATAFIATERFPEDLDDSEMERYNQAQRALLLSVYRSIRRENIFPVMGENEQLEFLAALMDQVKARYPQVADHLPHANTLESQDGYTPVTHYQSEAVVYRDVPPETVLIRFSEFPRNEYEKLISKADGNTYLYLVARITERFITQYQLQPEQRAWLEAAHPEFLVAIPVPISTERGVLAHVVLDELGQLQLLEEYPMLCSVSMLLTSDKRWSDWYDAINNYSTQFILFDLPPSEQLPRSFQGYDAVLYHVFHLGLDDEEYAFVVLIGTAGEMPTGIFFLPCSAVMASLLADMLGHMAPKFRLLDLDSDVNEDMLWLIRVAATRLLDESHFDFNALRSQYAQRGFAHAQFRGS